MLGLIEAGLGGSRVTKLTVNDVDAFLRLAAAGLGGRRPIGKAQLIRLGQALTAVLTNEQRLGHVIRNVGALAELPTQAHRRGSGRLSLRTSWSV